MIKSQTTLTTIDDAASAAIAHVERQKWKKHETNSPPSTTSYAVAQIANQFTGKNTQKKLMQLANISIDYNAVGRRQIANGVII
jgi:hypothetical protein